MKMSSKMAPMPTMMTGKLDTIVMISSRVFIWEAEASSMVAVWKKARTEYLYKENGL